MHLIPKHGGAKVVQGAVLAASQSRHLGFVTRFREKMADRKKPVVSVLNLTGQIAPNMGGGSAFGRNKNLNVDNLQTQIERAFAPKKLAQVLLKINSPGGTPSQCELISDLIWLKAKEKKVPVVSFVEDMAASGGYWLACVGEKIFVTKTSTVGSIGVIYANFGLDQFIQRYDISRRVITAGKSKSLMDPFQPTKDADVLLLQEILTNIHETFKDHVRRSRQDRLKADDDTLFNGQIWVGQKAVDLGLADGIDTINSYVDREFGKTVQVIRVKGPSGPLSRLMGGAEFEFGGPSSMLSNSLTLRAVENETLLLNKFKM
ncbi:Na(+)/H(+) antiporter NhaA-like [Tigriopus californicus]|uniref:Na(+)/H(+) antiporter NhaA-like n=1 Tax=Tigriopus californicus TaxID=6832 RepID=UPI0027DA8750|nr:Na(+)/H(+) antiporter NhaA-like [Tigriopus californicus]